MARHAEFPPSKLDQYLYCPAAYWMQKGIVEPPSEAAEEGTMLHERVVEDSLYGLDDEQKDAVERCIEFRESLGTTGVRMSEKSVAICDENGEELTFGTLDYGILPGDGTAKIIDWKFGRVPVDDVGHNIQLACYAAGVMQNFHVRSVEAHVFQPRIFQHSCYTFTDCSAIVGNVRAIIIRAQSTDLKFKVCEQACRFCTAKHKCPAYQLKYEGVKQLVGETVRAMDDEQLAIAYSDSKVVGFAVSEIEKELKRRLDENGSCGPYSYEMKEGAREIHEIQAIYERVKGYVNSDELMSICNLPVGKFETLVADRLKAEADANGENMTVKAAKAKVSEMCGDLIVRGTPKKNIVMA